MTITTEHLLVMFVGGFVALLFLGYVREKVIWRMTGDHTKMAGDFGKTLDKMQDCIDAKFAEAQRKAEHMEGLNYQNKQELVSLIVDMRRDVSQTVRDVVERHSNLSVNTFTGSGATVAQGHEVSQQQGR